MGKISMRSNGDAAREKVETTLEGTIIHKKQSELAYGRWDFAVFGPSSEGTGSVLRIGMAEQAQIQQASIYIAAVGDPGTVGHGGMMSLEELTDGDIAEELKGMEVYHVSPLRPMSISDKRNGQDIDRMRDKVLEEFGESNIAIIETPDQEAWALSVLKYLHECDEALPDPFISSVRGMMRDTSIKFGGGSGSMH